MKSSVDMWMSRFVMNPAMTGETAEWDNDEQAASQVTLESWARRAIWLLVAVTSLWEIAVTFDRHYE